MEYKGFTYTPTPKTAWDNLSMLEKSEMMKVAVRNGITDLKTIREQYNEFAEGGDTEPDWSYDSWKRQIAEHMGIRPDEDNTYDYEAFFNKYPEEAWKMLKGDPTAHFTDEFKTVYHPTFSSKSIGNDGSIYSGIKNPRTNPQGLVGGTWSPDYKVFTMSPDGYKGPVSMDERKWYLENAEDNGVQLREADGSLPVFDGIPWGGVLPNITVTGNRFAEGGNIYSGDKEETQQMEVSKSPHVDLAISNPWLYQKLHPAQRKTEKYEPTTFAGRITQLAGANELGQKYADYTSSVIQQVPVVGLVPSALDLGYDTNRLYHNPSLTTTKDITLDAASLVPALRKTMKGWWMKGNSGSFITEAGQIINNPRIASTLEVTLQPFRTAINTGVYGARAADFLDDSKAYLKEMYNSSKIGKHFPIKALGGPLVEAAMNEYKKGGGIHIAPSKKGTFTAAAKKHGKSVQAFASQVLAHPENYSPAMRKKANFARNAAKWHGEGGNLFNWKHGIYTEPANINLENNFDFLNKTLTRKSIR